MTKIIEAKIGERSKIRQTLFHSLLFLLVSLIPFLFFSPTGWTTTLRYDLLFWAILSYFGAYLSVKLNLESVQLFYNFQTVKSPVDMTHETSTPKFKGPSPTLLQRGLLFLFWTHAFVNGDVFFFVSDYRFCLLKIHIPFLTLYWRFRFA